MDFTTFTAPAAPVQEAPRVSCPPPQPAPAPVSAPFGGFTVSSAPPVPPQQPATAFRPAPETSAPAASGAVGVRRGFTPTEPAENEMIVNTFQELPALGKLTRPGNVAAAKAPHGVKVTRHPKPGDRRRRDRA